MREVNRLLGENISPNVSSSGTADKSDKKVHVRKNILYIQYKHLNPKNELKRIFGSKIIQAEQ